MPRDIKVAGDGESRASESATLYQLVPTSNIPGASEPHFLSHHFPLDFDKAGRMFRRGLVAIDPKGSVLFSNQQATEILEAGSGISLRKGSLFIERTSIQRTFEALIRRCVETQDDKVAHDRPVEYLGVPDRTGEVRYAITVVTIATRNGLVEILLGLVDLFDGRGPSRKTFAAVFRLSEREAELAELFSKGLGLEEISERMGVALNTTRVHLRSVFKKTNCSGQLALLRALSRLI
jgi:DNA-binding CsgD family transcriptional regulator